MRIEYKKKREILRTIQRPVLMRRPRYWEDIQSLPPEGWCQRCGGEVYEYGRFLCDTCMESLNLHLEEN